jgi:predicted RNase H-like HicB family nuclease
MATTARRAAKDYLDLPYSILVKADEGSGRWVAQVEELPGCTAHGENAEQATKRVRKAMEEWINAALARGAEVPEPRALASHSGRLLLRMPQSLHAVLARAAESEGVSLNQFITSSLASVIGWRQAGVRPSPDDGPGNATWTALRRNLIVLSVVGVIALVLLAIAVAQRL